LYLLFGWGVPCEASFSMGLGSFFPLWNVLESCESVCFPS
jgi:hypothetical protein